MRTLLASAMSAALLLSFSAGPTFALVKEKVEKVEVCHHTHSEKNPIVKITIPFKAFVKGHQKHGDTLAKHGKCDRIKLPPKPR